MIKSSLVEILRTFTKEDLAGFEDFVNSPFHNKKSNAVKLFTSIKEFAPEFDDGNLEKEKVWSRIFPKKAYNYGIMKNLIHDLTKLAEDYMVHLSAEKEITYNKMLIGELRLRGLYDLHKKQSGKFNGKLDKLPKDEYYYEDKIFMAREQLSINIDRTYTDTIKIEMMSSELNLFLLRYFLNALNLLSEEQRTNIRHNYDFVKYLLGYFEDNLEKFKNEEILLVYYYLLKASLKLDVDKDYNTAKRLLNEFFPRLNYMTKRNFYAVLVIISNKKKDLYPAKTDYYQSELLNLHLEMMERSLLGPEGSGKIEVEMYRNIVIMCQVGKETKILSEFAEKYSSRVDRVSEEALKNYSHAFICLLRDEFEKCLEYCSKVDFMKLHSSAKGGFWFKNDIKTLELRCFYELNLYENFIAASDAYRHFLVNSPQMNEVMKQRGLISNKHLKKLFILRMDNDIPGILKLKKTLMGSDLVTSKSWLIEKIEKLEK